LDGQVSLDDAIEQNWSLASPWTAPTAEPSMLLAMSAIENLGSMAARLEAEDAAVWQVDPVSHRRCQLLPSCP
jgi:hypothetical protein